MAPEKAIKPSKRKYDQLISPQRDETAPYGTETPAEDPEGSSDEANELTKLLSKHEKKPPPAADPDERRKSQKRSTSPPANREADSISPTRNPRNLQNPQTTDYKWRRSQVLNNVWYPGCKDRPRPVMGRPRWGFAQQEDGTYTLGYGNINGMLHFRFFVLVKPNLPQTEADLVPAHLCDIREEQLWMEEPLPPARLRRAPPYVGRLSWGFFLDPEGPDVLRVGYGIVVDVRCDYIFCFVVPSGKDEAPVLETVEGGLDARLPN
ncbi:hypothetical protein BJY00DRAFT_313584 [Aspergillus carlsbadensis]|nr:hypothetical protein BJY00DRAFT_313584 [Aspergillus carlsbadensis]